MEDIQKNHEAQRGLQNRHIQLIAIAGTIGTGLFLGAGKTIQMTGPSVIFAYILIGIAMFFFLRTIGEMLYNDPSQHSFLNFVTKYSGIRTGYFTQWSYWLVIIFVCISELTAIGTYIQFWLPHLPLWLIEIVMLALLFGLNTLNSRFFGETEFWFAMIKVAAILGMIVTAIILVASNFHYTTVLSGKTVNDTASLNNIFDGFQLFPHGAWNFVGALQMVMFAQKQLTLKRVYQKLLIKFLSVSCFSTSEHFWQLWQFLIGTIFQQTNHHSLLFSNSLESNGLQLSLTSWY